MEYQLKNTLPVPTKAEQEICELYAKAKWAEKEAERLKPDAEAIVAKYGQVSCEAGLLTVGESTSYPIPTLTEWEERLAELRRRLDAEQSATDSNPIVISKLEFLLESGQALTEDLASYHQWAEWLKNMKDFFKVSQPIVSVAKKSPTVKCYSNRRPAPPSRKFTA